MSDEKDKWKTQDSDMKEWLSQNACVTSMPWSKSQLQGLKSSDSPFYDTTVDAVNLSEHPSVSLMSKNAMEFQFQAVNVAPEKYSTKSGETFRIEFDNNTVDKQPIGDIKTDAATAITETREDFYKLLTSQPFRFKKFPDEDFLFLEYLSCHFEFEIIEPLTFSTFILENGKIVTETWNCFDPAFKPYFGEPHSKNAAFNIRNYSAEAYLVTVCNRTFQIDNGETTNSYYKKPTTALRDKARKVFDPVYKKLNNVWNTFAFTFYPLSQILDSCITMPRMFLAEYSSKALTAEMLTQQIERAMNGKSDQIGIEIRYASSTSSFGNSNALENCLVLHSTKPYNLYPVLSYQHRLLLNLNFGKFDLPGKLSARNIMAEVSFLQNGKPLKCIHTRWVNDELTDKVYSRALYHEKSPQFEDQFIIELPIPAEGLVLIRYYNLSTKPGDAAMQYFGNSSFEISPKHDRFIVEDSQKSLAILYQDQPNPLIKCSNNNYFSVTTLLHSSLVTNEPTLQTVYDGDKVLPSIDSIPDAALVNNLYLVLDSVLTNISQNPYQAVRGLVNLNRLVPTIPPDTLDYYLMNYVGELAFREGTKHDTHSHKHILKQWGVIIREFSNVIGAERKDILVVNFMFHLIIKSIMIDQTNDFTEELEEFIKEWSKSVCSLSEKGYAQAQKMNQAFAQFTSLMTDIGFYSAAAKCVIQFVLSFSDKPTEHRVIQNFLEHALHPRLFISQTLVCNGFVELFTKLFSRAISKSPADPIHQIFNIFDRTLAFLPDELKPLVAAEYVGLLSVFDTNLQGSPEQLWAPLSIVAFILKYIDCKDFQNYISSNQNIPKFIQFIHFFAVKTKYDKTLGSTMTSANIASLSSLEKQFESVGSGGSFGSIKGKPSVAGKRNFASVRRQATPSFGPASKQVYVPAKDIALEAQFGIINIMKHCLNMEEINYEIAIELLYHVLSMNIALEAVELMVETIILFITKNVKYLIESKAPPFILILKKILSIAAVKCKFVSNATVTIFPALLAAEKQAYGTNNRTRVQIIRAISLLSVSDLGSATLIEALNAIPKEKELEEIVKVIIRISKINTRLQAIDPEGFTATFASEYTPHVQKAKPSTEMDEYADLLWERACILQPSPDANLEALRILDQFHAANDYKIEAIVVKILQCALISEYLTPLGLMPKVFNKEHPALSFTSFSPIVASIIASQEYLNDMPNVPGFCDSPIFCEGGIVSIISEIAEFCDTEAIYEIINQLILLFIPLFEYHGMYEELQALFAKCKNYYTKLDATPKIGERLLGRYYRVAFYGQCFGEYDGRMFIYRETKLINLFNLTNRMNQTYSRLLPPNKLEIIKESGLVDQRLLEPDKGYIQLTFVNPAFDKSETPMKQTTFEINSHVHKFYFETPFIKGSKKLQGSVENQWIRRTFLNIKDELPTVVKRVELQPKDIVNIEYEPIRVAVRQLKERLAAYDMAIISRNISQIQPLLNGSLCVQVNEGPSKIAEVFLSGNRTRYTEKMRYCFRRFLEVNKICLEIHREAAKGNPNFTALQQQMDIGIKDLTSKLEKYL